MGVYMFIYALIFLLNITVYSVAEDVGVIITNYYYDEFGRPRGSSSTVQPGPYDPYRSPYDNRYVPYSPAGLPGADPDRFEDTYYENVRRR